MMVISWGGREIGKDKVSLLGSGYERTFLLFYGFLSEIFVLIF